MALEHCFNKLGQKIIAAVQKAKADAVSLEASVKKAVSDVKKDI